MRWIPPRPLPPFAVVNAPPRDRSGAAKATSCASCGAPVQAHEDACTYCLTPAGQLIEITTCADPSPVFIRDAAPAALVAPPYLVTEGFITEQEARDLRDAWAKQFADAYSNPRAEPFRPKQPSNIVVPPPFLFTLIERVIRRIFNLHRPS